MVHGLIFIKTVRGPFARLNNCANCDEADVSFVQTQSL